MPSLPFITSDQTVRQVAGAFPACAELLQRWPSALRGERWTLQQQNTTRPAPSMTIGTLALASGMKPRRLIEALNHATSNVRRDAGIVGEERLQSRGLSLANSQS